MDDEVFSKLPRTRPSVRSPRREAAAPAEKRKAPSRRATGTAKRDADTPAADGPARRPLGPEAPAAGQPGLEDLAKAGATAAVEVVGVGLRMGRWAIRGLRDTVERR